MNIGRINNQNAVQPKMAVKLNMSADKAKTIKDGFSKSGAKQLDADKMASAKSLMDPSAFKNIGKIIVGGAIAGGVLAGAAIGGLAAFASIPAPIAIGAGVVAAGGAGLYLLNKMMPRINF